MKHLKFVIEHEPEAYPLRAATYLYNNKVYLQSKERTLGKPLTFYALQGEVAVARIHFFLTRQPNGEVEAISIPASPFGSFEYSSALSTQTLTEFISYIKYSLISRGVNYITLKDCIEAYRFGIAYVLTNALKQEGFIEIESLINHHIEVDSSSLSHKMHKMEVKRLRKCQHLAMKIKEEPISCLMYYYSFLQECRQEKGWGLSLSYADILASQQVMPGRYHIYAVYHKNECIAASLAVRVTNYILYDFYHDARAAFKNLSPTVFLLTGLYQYCQQSNIKILDLGTSPTLSLQKFKEHLGGVLSYKRTYQYSV